MKASVKNRYEILLISFLLLVPALRIEAQQLKKIEGTHTGSTDLIEGEITELSQLKQALSEAQKKLSFDIVQLIHPEFLPKATSREAHALQMEKLHQFKSAGSAENLEQRISEGMIYVYIYLNPNASTNLINAYTYQVTDRDEENNLAVAWVKVKDLENLAALKEVRIIRTVMPPVTRTGSVTSEGDAIHQSDSVRTIYSQGGAGMKVGIISDGVDSRASSQATDDLPPDGDGLTVLSNSVGGDEGTAILEIVHDLAPDAELFFHDAGNNVVAFNNAIDSLVNVGCNIVGDDIGWITQPFFEDGTIASHLTSVLTANDIIYVSSAGNAGYSHYQGDFYPLSGQSNRHDFSEGQSSLSDLYISLPAFASARIVLQWNDQFGASGNDYDLYLYRLPSTLVASSASYQNGDGDPLEFMVYSAPGGPIRDYAIRVTQYAGATKTLEVYMYLSGATVYYTNNIKPGDAIFGHPAVPNAIAAGAIDASDPGNDDIEDFSSRGPVTISYPSPEVRNKPDICGIDGVSVTGAGGFPSTFYGTSAAMPHVAAIAAQMWAQIPDSSRDQVRSKLLNSAIDFGVSAAGYDSVFGNGRADALDAFQDNIALANLKVYLEGPYSAGGDSMTTAINADLPLSQPYSGTPWNFGGNENVSSIPPDVVDWVLVDLRTDTAANSKVVSRAAFLNKNGSIVDLDGSSPLSMPKGENNYYIVVHQRNHLSIMSAVPQGLYGLSSLYDFTTSQNAAFGVNPMKDIGNGVLGMYAGDGNKSGIVTIADRNAAFLDRDSVGYLDTDYNLSGIVTISDVNAAYLNRDANTRVP